MYDEYVSHLPRVISKMGYNYVQQFRQKLNLVAILVK